MTIKITVLFSKNEVEEFVKNKLAERGLTLKIDSITVDEDRQGVFTSLRVLAEVQDEKIAK